MQISGKTAVVTGAASGIGEALARELAKRGAGAVMLIDRSDRVFELARSLNEAHGRSVADAHVGDATDEAFRKRVFDEVVEGGLSHLRREEIGFLQDVVQQLNGRGLHTAPSAG